MSTARGPHDPRARLIVGDADTGSYSAEPAVASRRDQDTASEMRRDPETYGFAATLAMRAPQTYWCYSPRTKIVRLLDAAGWRRVEDAREAKLVWGRVPGRIDWPSLASHQLVDWVRGMEHVTDKGRLARVLREVGVAERLQPETYLLDDAEDLARLRERALVEPETVWIAKPTNRGSGIGVELVTDVEDFCARWVARSARGEIDDPYLVQRYIRNPLLLDGTKSEVRSYCLVASVDPLLALFHDGTARLSLRAYSDDWADPLRHINNVYRQKRADPSLYARHAAELKWTLGRMESHLHERGLTSDLDFVDTSLRPRLRGVFRDVLRAVEPRLDRRPGSFQLIGMDCILSDDLRDVWLTEIQRGPGLSVRDPVKLRLIPPMLEEALEIVLEVDDRRRSGAGLAHLDSIRNFRWIINDAIEIATPDSRAR